MNNILNRLTNWLKLLLIFTLLSVFVPLVALASASPIATNQFDNYPDGQSRFEAQTTSSCDNFTSSLNDWNIVSSSGTGAISNPPGLMRLSSNTSASGVTVKKPLLDYSGSITITSVFTSHSPTTIYFWVEYADASIDYIFAEGTSSGGVQTYLPSYSTPEGKTPVALYFYAAVSSLFPPFQIDIDYICVTDLTSQLPSDQTLYFPLISKGPDIYPFRVNPATSDITHSLVD